MRMFINFSGGKDSSAMGKYLLERYDGKFPIHFVMSNTGWEHIETAYWKDAVAWAHYIIEEVFNQKELNVVAPVSDFWARADARQKFPSPSQRWCTSDLKRGPIQKFIRATMQDGETAINCMGMRAEESPARAKLEAVCLNEQLTISKRKSRTVFDWLPIHSWTTEQVFEYCKKNSIPLHPVYSYGIPRFSCRICIFGRAHLGKINRYDPAAIEKVAGAEQRYGFTFYPGETVGEILASNHTEEDHKEPPCI